MTAPPTVVVLAAGEGKRLGGPVPKVLTPLWGRPSVAWAVAVAAALEPESLTVVCGESLRAVQQALEGLPGPPAACVRQAEPKGTGDALLAAHEALEAAQGPILVLYGDCPLIGPVLLAELLEAHDQAGADLTLLTAQLEDPAGYGRVVRDEQGRVQAIVEAADADEATLDGDEINTGIWVVQPAGLVDDLRALGSANAQNEVYLTDLVAARIARGDRVATVSAEDPDEVLGFNDPLELSLVRRVLRERILADHLTSGVEIVDPETTYIDADVVIEAGARILPCTVIEGHCRIGAGCEVGPFSHLRNGTVLDPGAEVGNFTETKKTRLGAGSKAKHLTYLGDTTIGPGANIGAGTITANYDGKAKHPTHIGAGAFIGSGSVLVAPSTVEDGGVTGAGAILTRRSVVRKGETWVGVPARPLKQAAPDPDTTASAPPAQP